MVRLLVIRCRHRLSLGTGAFLSAVLLAACPPAARGQEDDPGLKERFLREAPARWEEYTRLTKELQGVVLVSYTSSRGNSRADNRLEYKVNGGSAVLTGAVRGSHDGTVDDEGGEAVGFNPRYAFVLSRKSPAASWALGQFSDRGTGPDPGRIATQINGYLQAANFGTYLDGHPLTEVVRQSGFRVRACRAVRTGGEELAEVAFTYSRMDGPWRRNLEGTLLLDPARYWCWRSGEVRAFTEGFSTGTMKLRGTQSDAPAGSVPLSRVWKADSDASSLKEEWSNRMRRRYEVTLTRPDRLSGDEEFTLSAFGLPEPPGVKWEKPTPRYVWFLLAAGGFAVLMVGFRYLARRRTPKPTVPA